MKVYFLFVLFLLPVQSAKAEFDITEDDKRARADESDIEWNYLEQFTQEAIQKGSSALSIYTALGEAFRGANHRINMSEISDFKSIDQRCALVNENIYRADVFRRSGRQGANGQEAVIWANNIGIGKHYRNITDAEFSKATATVTVTDKEIRTKSYDEEGQQFSNITVRKIGQNLLSLKVTYYQNGSIFYGLCWKR